MKSLPELIKGLFRMEKRYTMSSSLSVLANGNMSNVSLTGVPINATTALQISAVYACVRVLAESIASLPLILYKRIDSGGKERATQHPLYRILHDSPNPHMTPTDFWEAMVGHVALRGNAFAYISRDGNGRPVAIYPLHPDNVTIARAHDGALVYQYSISGINGSLWASEEDILHIKGLSPDGIQGYSPLSLARESFGLTSAIGQYSSRYFSKNAQPSGILKIEQDGMTPEAKKGMREAWENAFSGLSNAHGVAVLEGPVSWQSISVSPEDSQMLESRKFQVNEIARIFRIPPHLIGDLEKSSFNNIETMSLEFVIYTLRPWLVRIERAISQKLLFSFEKDTYFPEFLIDGLLRGDIKTRYAAYAVGRQWGFLSVNDIKALENMNPIGEEGDIYLSPYNMQSAEDVLNPPADKPQQPTRQQLGEVKLLKESVESRSEAKAKSKYAVMRNGIIKAHIPSVEDVMARVIRRERADVGRAAKKYLSGRSQLDFNKWLDEFYQEHATWTADQVRAAFKALAKAVGSVAAAEVDKPFEITDDLQAWVDKYITDFSELHAKRSKAQILGVIADAVNAGEDVVAAVDQRLSEWVDGREEDALPRSGKIAEKQTHKLAGGFTKTLWVGLGVTLFRWVAMGDDPCPLCLELDGQVVGAEHNFVNAGDKLQPEGVSSPFSPSTNIGHAPLHSGCECTVVPELGD